MLDIEIIEEFLNDHSQVVIDLGDKMGSGKYYIGETRDITIREFNTPKKTFFTSGNKGINSASDVKDVKPDEKGKVDSQWPFLTFLQHEEKAKHDKDVEDSQRKEPYTLDSCGKLMVIYYEQSFWSIEMERFRYKEPRPWGILIVKPETAEKAEQLYCYYSIENRGLHHDNVDFNIIVQKKLKTKDLWDKEIRANNVYFNKTVSFTKSLNIFYDSGHFTDVCCVSSLTYNMLELLIQNFIYRLDKTHPVVFPKESSKMREHVYNKGLSNEITEIKYWILYITPAFFSKQRSPNWVSLKDVSFGCYNNVATEIKPIILDFLGTLFSVSDGDIWNNIYSLFDKNPELRLLVGKEGNENNCIYKNLIKFMGGKYFSGSIERKYLNKYKAKVESFDYKTDNIKRLFEESMRTLALEYITSRADTKFNSCPAHIEYKSNSDIQYSEDIIEDLHIMSLGTICKIERIEFGNISVNVPQLLNLQKLKLLAFKEIIYANAKVIGLGIDNDISNMLGTLIVREDFNIELCTAFGVYPDLTDKMSVAMVQKSNPPDKVALETGDVVDNRVNLLRIDNAGNRYVLNNSPWEAKGRELTDVLTIFTPAFIDKNKNVYPNLYKLQKTFIKIYKDKIIDSIRKADRKAKEDAAEFGDNGN